MSEKKIISLLKSLNKEEIRLVKSYFQSKFCNANKLIERIALYLLKQYPHFSSKKTANLPIHKHFFPDTPYKAKKINDLLSDISLLIEDCMRILLIRKDNELKKSTQKEIYKSRKLDTLYKRSLTKEIDSLSNKEVKNESDYNRLILLYKELIESSRESQLSPEFLTSIHQYSELTNESFYLSFLKNYITQKTSNKMYQIESSEEEHQLLQLILQSDKYDHNPLITIYKLLANQITGIKSYEAFSKLKLLFDTNVDHIAETNAIQIWSILQHLASSPTLSNQNIDRDSLELYQMGDRKNWLVRGKNISEIRFINIVITALLIKELNWFEFFIEKYKYYLEEKIREETIVLSRGMVYYYDENWKAAVKTMKDLTTKSFPNSIRLRLTLTRSMYNYAFYDNSEYFEELELKINASDKFFRRKGFLNPERQKVYLNFFAAVKKLIKLNEKLSLEQSDIDEVVQFIDDKKNQIVSYHWLSQKLKELSND